jgi:hypothetical protein
MTEPTPQSPLFQVTNDAGHNEHNALESLRTLLNKQTDAASSEVLQTGQPVHLFCDDQAREFYEKKAQSQKQGRFLNQIDCEIGGNIASGGKSPLAQLQFDREKVLAELQKLNTEKQTQLTLNTQESTEKIAIIEQKKTVLRQKMKTIDEQLEELNPFHSMVKLFLKSEAAANETTTHWDWLGGGLQKLRNRFSHEEIAETSQSLRTIQNTVSSHLHDPQFSSQELGELINAFEIQAAQAEKMAHALKHKTSIKAFIQSKLPQKS